MADDRDLLTLTTRIVAAHLAANTVQSEAVPGLIRTVYSALAAVGVTPEPEAVLEPAVPVKRSIHTDYLVCLEDGAKLKTLKRYLQARYGLSPDAYRAKWGLPPDYPMVAPAYTARRSALAKQLGLGRKPQAAEPEQAFAEDIVEDSQDAPAVTFAPPEPTFEDVPHKAASRHTAESVFANFKSDEEPAPAKTPADALPEKPSRKRFAQQSMRPTRAR